MEHPKCPQSSLPYYKPGEICFDDSIPLLPPSPFQGTKDTPGDGKEATEEEVNSPMFVPTVGMFFQHDTREGEGEGEDDEKGKKPE